MKRRDKIAIARMLLVLLLILYGGKALHVHSEAYYSAQTASSSEGNFKDDCIICHFSVFPYLEAESEACPFFATTLLFVFPAIAARREAAAAALPTLRAPPSAA